MHTLRAATSGSVALVLEPQTAAHALQMFPVLSDPAIYRYENQPPASVQSLLERFVALERRGPADGTEQWLNWVVRVEPEGDLAGYVQASVNAQGAALVAYEFASAWWGRGIAFAAVTAMLDELASSYSVQRAYAVFKTVNTRSERLLQRLGFELTDSGHPFDSGIEADELCRSRVLR